MTTILTLSASPAVNIGSGLVGLPCSAHGLAAGTPFNLQGTAHYDGTYLVETGSSTNQIAISATYTAETFVGTELVIPLPQDQWRPQWLLTINVRT
jgi:phage tail sheath gpL-like